MKKAVKGLVGVIGGIALSFAAGCQIYYPYNKEVSVIRYHHNELKRILGVEEGESYHIFDTNKKGEVCEIVVIGKDSTIIRRYIPNKDGEYEHRDITKIPRKFDINVLPLPKPEPNGVPGEYKPENKRKKEERKLFI